jgi:hypothetical protein
MSKVSCRPSSENRNLIEFASSPDADIQSFQGAL